MQSEALDLTQFRTERTAAGIIHLIFDMPARSMNVFSNAAIKDLVAFAAWVAAADVRGVVLRSGKASAFCAGADLIELGQAYDMIMAAPPAARHQVAFDHFFKLSAAVRALETCGKPVATAIGGLALGGGCEISMGTHYRVLANTPKAALGLPESLVGLLPGAGGTQRLPRLVGIDAALPILLEGGRLSGEAALLAGLVDELVPPGDEVAAAERWVLMQNSGTAPWDRPDWRGTDTPSVQDRLAAERQKILLQTQGHYPAPLAILDCLEQGFPQPFDTAIRTEMAIFSDLIQRPEPRDMIRTMFVAKTEYDRQMKAGALPAPVQRAAADLAVIWQGRDAATAAALAAAGFGSPDGISDESHEGPGYWFDRAPVDARKQAARAVLAEIADHAARLAGELSAAEQRLADYEAVSKAGFPAYLGGPFCLATHFTVTKGAPASC